MHGTDFLIGKGLGNKFLEFGWIQQVDTTPPNLNLPLEVVTMKRGAWSSAAQQEEVSCAGKRVRVCIRLGALDGLDDASRIEQRFLATQADPFAGREWARKKSTCFARNDGGVVRNAEDRREIVRPIEPCRVEGRGGVKETSSALAKGRRRLACLDPER
jgi:hypothetical protein